MPCGINPPEIALFVVNVARRVLVFLICRIASTDPNGAKIKRRAN